MLRAPVQLLTHMGWKERVGRIIELPTVGKAPVGAHDAVLQTWRQPPIYRAVGCCINISNMEVYFTFLLGSVVALLGSANVSHVRHVDS